jgi:transcriptional regulator with XRE-family HTH domain
MVTTKKRWGQDEIDRLRYRCRQARLRNDLHQKALAERLGWSINTIGNFERGENTPTPANLGRLAALVDELLENALVTEDGHRPGDRAADGKTQGGHPADDKDDGGGQAMVDGSKESDWRLLLKAHKRNRPELVEELSTLFEEKESNEQQRRRIERSIQTVAKKLESWAIGLSMIPILTWLGS